MRHLTAARTPVWNGFLRGKQLAAVSLPPMAELQSASALRTLNHGLFLGALVSSLD